MKFNDYEVTGDFQENHFRREEKSKARLQIQQVNVRLKNGAWEQIGFVKFGSMPQTELQEKPIANFIFSNESFNMLTACILSVQRALIHTTLFHFHNHLVRPEGQILVSSFRNEINIFQMSDNLCQLINNRQYKNPGLLSPSPTPFPLLQTKCTRTSYPYVSCYLAMKICEPHIKPI